MENEIILHFAFLILNFLLPLHRFGVIRSKANAHEVLNY